jgi:glycosyltransferase involved in cell wall biosynthesis
VTSSTTSGVPVIRVVALIEAASVTGPAKNLIEFARRARENPQTDDLPRVEVCLAAFRRAGMGEGSFVPAACAAGVPVDIIDERFRFDWHVIAELKRVVERHQPDLVQTHSVKSHFLVRLTGLYRRYPWIAFHHGYTTTDLKMRLYNQLNRWSLPSARRVVTVCGPFARILEREGVAAGRLRVLHNTVVRKPAPPAGAVEALRERYKIPPQAAVVLAVGRFSREKAHIDLIRAFERLRQIDPASPAVLVFAGDGPERPHAEAAAKQAGLASCVVFAGHQSDVAPWYALARVVALPSHSEGSPNVLLEAMAAGVPVVSTEVGGVPEIATHEVNALLVAPRDAEAMARAILRLLADADLAKQLAANAAARVAERYTPESYRRALTRIYRDVLDQR